MTKMIKVDLMRRPNKALWRFNDLRPHLVLECLFEQNRISEKWREIGLLNGEICELLHENQRLK